MHLYFLIATPNQIRDNSVLKEHRIEVLEERQKLYQWETYDNGIPSSIDESVCNLPLDEHFEKAKMVNFLGNFLRPIIPGVTGDWRVKLNHLLEKALGRKVDEGASLKNLQDFEFLAKTLIIENLKTADPPQPLPPDINIPVYEGYRFVSDVEFGRQILNGSNPSIIQRCKTIPPNFAVKGEMVNGLLNRGKTLEQEMLVCYIICMPR